MSETTFDVPSLTPQPRFSLRSFPTLAAIGLSDDEQRLVDRLQQAAWVEQKHMALDNAYYEGEQALTNLGIAVPDELAVLRTVIGWPALAVDPIAERLSIEGFRLAGATDSDPDLWDLWDANDMQAQVPMGHLDALVMRSGWVTIGSPDTRGDPPVIRVESPLNCSALWDGRSMTMTAVLQAYEADGGQQAVLYVPGESVYLATDENNTWQVTNRDRHGYGIPVERIVNRPRTHNRDGKSEITPFVKSWTDAACRALLQLQVAGEFYSVPRYLLLGASESDFQDANGNPKSTWDAYITRILALERDENDNVPTVTQLTAYDPSVFTRVLDFYAAKLAGPLRATPQDFGIYTEGNPPSADAVQFSESRRDRYAIRKQEQFGCGWVRALQHAVRFANGGKLPADMTRIEVDWAPPSIPSIGAVGSFLSQMIATGVLPPESDVVLKRAGFSAVERAQIAQDRQTHQAVATMQQIGQRYLSAAIHEGATESGG